MKLAPFVSTTAVLATALAFAGSARAKERSWYVRGDLGVNLAAQVDADRDIDLENAAFGAAGVGYDLGNGLRAEGEMLFTKSDLEDEVVGDATTVGGFTNIVDDINAFGGVTPFVGAGLGFARVKLDEAGVDDEDTGFAYQAKAGASYRINDRLTAELAYRYLRVNDVEFVSSASRLDGGLDSKAVTVGLRYKLGS